MSAALDRRAVLLGGLAGMVLPAWGVAPKGASPEVDVWRAQVILLRHAEKQAGDDPELTEAGYEAARALAALLSSAGVNYLEHSPYRRTAQTLGPLVELTGIEPEVADPRDADALRERITALPDGAVAVIAGHSNTIPPAVVALGGELADLDAKGHIHEQVYDRLFVVSLSRVGVGPLVASTLELRTG
jgi:phosphohistidine phosphatase SixA